MEWSPVADATSYEVYLEGPENEKFFISYTSNVILTDLIPNYSYSFSVRTRIVTTTEEEGVIETSEWSAMMVVTRPSSLVTNLVPILPYGGLQLSWQLEHDHPTDNFEVEICYNENDLTTYVTLPYADSQLVQPVHETRRYRLRLVDPHTIVNGETNASEWIETPLISGIPCTALPTYKTTIMNNNLHRRLVNNYGFT